MSLKFIRRNYVKYNKGTGFLCCHVDAQHASPPEADRFTDKIAAKLIAQTGCAGIIGTVSRTKADLNRGPDGKNNDALQEYRDTIKEILNHLGILDYNKHQVTKPYLHLSIHGMKDVHHGPYAIEIGTLHGQSCSPETKDWLQEFLTVKAQEILPEIDVIFDEIFDGDESIVFHRLGDKEDYPGYGFNFHTFQIEIARTLREDYLPEIVELFSQIIVDFQIKFVNQQ
jgi:hypothetical protein